MRLALVIVVVLGALLPPLGGAAGTAAAWAQSVTQVKPGAGEKARKTKTFPAYTESHRGGRDSLYEYKMSLSATDTVSANGKRTGFITLKLSSKIDGGEAAEGSRSLDRAALRVLEANLGKISRLGQRYRSPKTRHEAYEYIPQTRLVMPNGVELFLNVGTGADAKPDRDNQWSVFFREPKGEGSADFGCQDWKQLDRFKRQLSECAVWLDRKKF